MVGLSRFLLSSLRTRPTARWSASCTMRRAFPSWCATWPPRSTSARGATRRDCTSGPGGARSRASRGSTRNTSLQPPLRLRWAPSESPRKSVSSRSLPLSRPVASSPSRSPILLSSLSPTSSRWPRPRKLRPCRHCQFVRCQCNGSRSLPRAGPRRSRALCESASFSSACISTASRGPARRSPICQSQSCCRAPPSSGLQSRARQQSR
mmetsp:Transcript_22575/g.67927  ORF Transcript_22575/g.67927 Transcript_22575/m.67927 type:complete len:208 (+) Transcript_22575:455-1078(+)